MKLQGWIIINKDKKFAWDDNTEFYTDFNIASIRTVELTQGTEPGTQFEVVPATLTCEALRD